MDELELFFLSDSITGYLFTAALFPGRLTHLIPEHESWVLEASQHVHKVNDESVSIKRRIKIYSFCHNNNDR